MQLFQITRVSVHWIIWNHLTGVPSGFHAVHWSGRGEDVKICWQASGSVAVAQVARSRVDRWPHAQEIMFRWVWFSITITDSITAPNQYTWLLRLHVPPLSGLCKGQFLTDGSRLYHYEGIGWSLGLIKPAQRWWLTAYRRWSFLSVLCWSDLRGQWWNNTQWQR